MGKHKQSAAPAKEFNNPYHFVPTPRARTLEEEKQAGSHDRYDPACLSGRLVCRLLAEAPFFVGATRSREATEKQAARVEPFLLDGRPAIPASTLRGLISNIAEAASQSSLRVLQNQGYRTRYLSDVAFCIGVLEQAEGSHQLKIRPLALGALLAEEGIETLKVPQHLSPFFKPPLFPVRLGAIKERPQGVFYGMRLAQIEWKNGNAAEKTIARFENLQVSRKEKGVMGQRPSSSAEPRLWSEIPRSERKQYTRGRIAVLGHWDRDRKRHHEGEDVFVPDPEDCKNPLLDIDEKTLKSLWTREALRLGLQRKLRSGSGGEPRPCAGDVVYFRYCKEREIVTEIDLGPPTAHSLFRALSENLLPLNEFRTEITTAEELFGYVEQRYRPSRERDERSRSLAGKLRFSNGLYTGRLVGSRLDAHLRRPFLKPVVLKILDSPKPPNPAFYFKGRQPQDKIVLKEHLTADRHWPQGRKMYLHHPNRGKGHGEHLPPWKTQYADDDLQQKTEITPLRKGSQFYFHVDFDNLSRNELDLLAYSLAPEKDFHHKLGMGKPLGLGTVKIQPIGVFLVDRESRYSGRGFGGPRFQSRWSASGEKIEDWPSCYSALNDDVRRDEGLDLVAASARHRAILAANHQDISNALHVLGKLDGTADTVCYPLTKEQFFNKDLEREHFRWWTSNERAPRKEQQNLAPIGDSEHRVPTLKANKQVESKKSSGKGAQSGRRKNNRRRRRR